MTAFTPTNGDFDERNWAGSPAPAEEEARLALCVGPHMMVMLLTQGKWQGSPVLQERLNAAGRSYAELGFR